MLMEGNTVCAYAGTPCMCVFLLVTETHISATTKQLGHEGVLLLAPFYNLNQPLAQYIYHQNGTKAAQPDPAESLQQTLSEHTVNTTAETCPQSPFCTDSAV